MNVHGSWRNHALALGLPKETSPREQVEEFARRWDAFPVAPERRAEAPWLENTLTGDDVDLFRVLPLFRLNDGDGGFYLDKAAVVSRDPADPDHFGKQNLGTYRLEVIGRDRLALQPVPVHDIAQHLRTAEENGEDLPVAITLGNDPVVPIVAGMPLRYDQSEYEMAGALRSTPMPIATAPHTGLDVPWGAEVVIEGVVESRKRQLEGKFHIHRPLLGRPADAGHPYRADLLPHRPGLRVPVPRHAVDRVRLPGGPEHQRAAAEATARRVPRGARRQRDVHARAAGHHLHGQAVRRFRQGGRDARHDHAARPGVRLPGHPGRRGRGPVRPAAGDVGAVRQGEPEGGRRGHPEPVGGRTRPGLPAGRRHQQDDHRRDDPVGPDVRGNFGTPVKDLPETAEWAAKLRTLLAGR
ncbi:Phenolic acid decarboxylase [Streptomyces fumanus]